MPTLLATLVLVLVAVTPAWAHETFKATLSGLEEVPPVATQTTGDFKIQFNKAQTEAEFTLTVNDGVRIIVAHLHCGVVGVNGPVVVFLAGLNENGYNVDGKWISSATLTNTSIILPPPPGSTCGASLAALAASIRAGRVYANVHSVAHPGGVIRGQLKPTGKD